MSITKKLAALAAFAALSAPALALEVDLTAYAIGLDVEGLVDSEFAAPAGSLLTLDGSYAQIFQEGASGNAFIDQQGLNNFGSVVQIGQDAATGLIFQNGDLNRAGIYQH